MERRIGPLRAEVVDPESAKFTAPLLLLHGLWSKAAIWRPFTGYLAHRGWLSVAPELEPEDPAAASVASIEHALAAVVAALPARPVIIGHDLGALHALRLAGEAVAVVALAPLTLQPYGAPPPALRKAGSWIDRLTHSNSQLRAPRGHWRASYPPHDNPLREPKRLIEELCLGSFEIPKRQAIPTYMMSGDQDPVTSMDALKAMASRIGAELQVESGSGHALPVDKGWDRRVSALHRWLVHALGPSLLAMLDESEEE